MEGWKGEQNENMQEVINKAERVSLSNWKLKNKDHFLAQKEMDEWQKKRTHTHPHTQKLGNDP